MKNNTEIEVNFGEDLNINFDEILDAIEEHNLEPKSVYLESSNELLYFH